MSSMAREIEKSLIEVNAWIKRNGWLSYDPNDIKGHPLFLTLVGRKSLFRRVILFLLYSLYAIAPVTLRRIFEIQPNITAGGMGFLASGYIELYKTTKNPENLDEAKRILDWLVNNRIDGYEDYCWGFPFDWQSAILVPKHTPIAYTTAECAKAFIEYYKLKGDEWALNVAIGACESIIRIMKRKEQGDFAISFSYTPLSNTEVINSNAVIASVFWDVGQIAVVDNIIELARKVAAFVIKEQLPNGSWCYFSHRYKDGPSVIDNYHNAIILQSLLKLLTSKVDRKTRDIYKESFIRGLKFYLSNFFTREGMPKIQPNQLYPVNIASCAEAITLFSELKSIEVLLPASLYKKAQQVNERLVTWTINNMQATSGAFITRKYPFKNLKLYSIRWADVRQ